jgi:copper chaperone CopZ
MEVLKFKTNINCGNCIRAVKGFLDEAPTVEAWSVDTDKPDKILTVEGAVLDEHSVRQAVEEAGFDLERIA